MNPKQIHFLRNVNLRPIALSFKNIMINCWVVHTPDITCLGDIYTLQMGEKVWLEKG